MTTRATTQQVVADKYRLEHELGRGGMGSVWRAHHLALNALCAIKLLNADLAHRPDARARFEREAHAAARIRSPHVVQILDYGVWQGHPFIAMELLVGEDLANRLRRAGRLDPVTTVDIVTQIADALYSAHASGIVHRDLKPSNVFLQAYADREIVKLVDFGVAFDTQGTRYTEAGQALGTPRYMSPEQAQGDTDVDHRTDLWSLAIIAYHCLCGVEPFGGDATTDVFRAIMYGPVPLPPPECGLPPAFNAWWARAAARDRSHRFQSASELSDALRAALQMTVASVRPSYQPEALDHTAPAPIAAMGTQPPTPPPLASPPRKSRLAFGVLAVAAVGLAGSLGWWSLQTPPSKDTSRRDDEESGDEGKKKKSKKKKSDKKKSDKKKTHDASVDGAPCKTENERRCQSGTSMLVCQAGSWRGFLCRGQLGCTGEGASVACDISGNESGAACPKSDHERAVCTPDKKQRMRCLHGKITVDTCGGPQGCNMRDGNATCDTSLSAVGGTCHREKAWACTRDQKQALICKNGQFVLLAECRGKRGCYLDTKKEQASCDQDLGSIGDACLREGEWACTADGKEQLTCKNGQFVHQFYCNATPCNVLPGGRHTCEYWN